MRTLFTFTFIVLVSTLAYGAPFGELVDLGAPGAMQALQQRNPGHYAKARAILDIARTRPDWKLRPIEVEYNASDIELAELWRPSNPPSLKVAFTLDHTRHFATVVPDLPPPKIVPPR